MMIFMIYGQIALIIELMATILLLLLEPNKGSQAEANYIDISNIEYLNNGKLFDFYAQITKNKHIISFFNPNYIRMIILNSHKILNKYENLIIYQ